MSKKLNLLFSFILIILLIALGLYLYRRHSGLEPQPKFSTERAVVTKLDADGNTLEGFPEGMPLNPANITEQSKIDYPDQGTVLYSLSYRSSLSREDIIAQYKNYFDNKGYITRSMYTGAAMPMNLEVVNNDANKNETISVVVSADDGFNLVKLGALHVN